MAGKAEKVNESLYNEMLEEARDEFPQAEEFLQEIVDILSGDWRREEKGNNAKQVTSN